MGWILNDVRSMRGELETRRKIRNTSACVRRVEGHSLGPELRPRFLKSADIVVDR
jgi:hypothetical protein